MKDCLSIQDQLEQIIADGTGMTAELQEHVAQCATCHAVLELHHRFDTIDMGHVPDETSFQAMRSRVLRQLNTAPPSRIHPLWLPAALAAGIVLGFMSGRSGGETSVLGESLASYANVAVNTLADGRVTLSYDITHRESLVAEPSDPRVGHILAQSMVQPASLYQRLEALDAAHEVFDPEVRDALIYAMNNDPEISVRLKASEILAGQEMDQAISEAFVALLTSDANTSLKLNAMT